MGEANPEQDEKAPDITRNSLPASLQPAELDPDDVLSGTLEMPTAAWPANKVIKATLTEVGGPADESRIELPSVTIAPVILAPMDIRRFMRKIVERDFPELAVLSYQELTPSANVQPLERVKLAAPRAA